MFRSSEGRRESEQDLSVERLSSRVQVLAERVDTLAQTVATTAAAIAKKDGELAIIRKQLEASHERVEAALSEPRPVAGDELRRLKDAVAGLAAERSRSSDDGRLARLEQKVALLMERVDTLATTVATTAAGLAGREGEVVALRRRVEQFAGRPDGGPAIDDALRHRIDDLGTAVASTSMRLESQAEQISSFRDSVALVVERLERAERERAALAASVGGAAAARWRDLERTLTALAGRLDASEQDRGRQDAALARATSLWPAALRSLEARVDALSRPAESDGAAPSGPPPPSGTARAADVARFLGEIRALERRIEEAEAHARHERDELSARLRQIEAAAVPGSREPEPVGGDVLPFRAPEN